MTDILEKTTAKDLMDLTKPQMEGLIEFVKLDDTSLIPVDTSLGRLYIRKPVYADKIAAMKFHTQYEDLNDKDWRELESLYVSWRMIVKPVIPFEDLINRPLDEFVEIAKRITEKLPRFSLDMDSEATKKK